MNHILQSLHTRNEMVNIILRPLSIVTKRHESQSRIALAIAVATLIQHLTLNVRVRFNIQSSDCSYPWHFPRLIHRIPMTLLLILKVQEALKTLATRLQCPRRPGVTGQQLGIDLRLGEIVDVHLCMT
jgi:hypothetical protein